MIELPLGVWATADELFWITLGLIPLGALTAWLLRILAWRVPVFFASGMAMAYVPAVLVAGVSTLFVEDLVKYWLLIYGWLLTFWLLGFCMASYGVWCLNTERSVNVTVL
jgi:hypothetical protein